MKNKPEYNTSWRFFARNVTNHVEKKIQNLYFQHFRAQKSFAMPIHAYCSMQLDTGMADIVATV